jgi:hypothetical protein
MTSRSSIVPFWLWSSGKLNTHQACHVCIALALSLAFVPLYTAATRTSTI